MQQCFAKQLGSAGSGSQLSADAAVQLWTSLAGSAVSICKAPAEHGSTLQGGQAARGLVPLILHPSILCTQASSSQDAASLAAAQVLAPASV